MKTADIVASLDDDTTVPDEGDPTYQQECLALDLRGILKNLSDEGFVLTSTETSDLSAFSTEVADGVDDYVDRFEEMLVDGTSEIVAYIPDVLSIMAALLSGGAEPVLAILLQGVLDTIIRHTIMRADVAGGDATKKALEDVVVELQNLNTKLETSAEATVADELTTLFTELKEQLAVTLNEFTINLANDPLAQQWTVEPPGS